MFGHKKLQACRLCGHTGLELVYDLGKQYVVDFIPTRELSDWIEGKKEQPIPLSIVVCSKCSFVQLGQSVDADRLYRKFWYKSGINEGMGRILKGIVDVACDTIQSWDNMAVLDIGSNDGTLLSFYRKGVLKVGFDPALNLVDEAKEKADTPYIYGEYFDKSRVDTMKSIAPTGFHVITAIAMFYDLEDPRAFLDTIKQVLHRDGVFVIQMNSLLSMLQYNAVDNIAHEHLGYYSLRALQTLVESCGLGVLDAEMNGVNGGSYKVTLCHLDKLKGIENWQGGDRIKVIIAREDAEKLTEIETYMAFGKRIDTALGKINQYLAQCAGNREHLYLYGASTRGSTLMQLVNPEIAKLFKGAAERNPEKFGHHMVGTWIPILDENRARTAADVFMVLPWHFGHGLLEREDSAMAMGVKFLYPLPRPRVYSQKVL